MILFHTAIRCIYPKGKKLWVTSCTRVLPQLCTFFSKLEAIVSSSTLVKPRYYCQFIFLITSLLTYKRSFPLKIRLYKNKLPFISTGSSATEHKTEQSGTKHHQRSLDTANTGILCLQVEGDEHMRKRSKEISNTAIMLRKVQLASSKIHPVIINYFHKRQHRLGKPC